MLSLTTNKKNRYFPAKNGRKTSFKNVTMVTKMLHVYISVTVPDNCARILTFYILTMNESEYN